MVLGGLLSSQGSSHTHPYPPRRSPPSKSQTSASSCPRSADVSKEELSRKFLSLWCLLGSGKTPIRRSQIRFNTDQKWN